LIYSNGDALKKAAKAQAADQQDSFTVEDDIKYVFDGLKVGNQFTLENFLVRSLVASRSDITLPQLGVPLELNPKLAEKFHEHIYIWRNLDFVSDLAGHWLNKCNTEHVDHCHDIPKHDTFSPTRLLDLRV
jgi:hypothetical protein